MFNRGLLFICTSAVGFSALGILTQLTYSTGASIGTSLTGRFVVAAALLWGLVAALRVRRPSRRQVVAGLALGVGYAVHAQLFAEALARLDAGVVDLLMFTYPAIVMVGAVALRRDTWSRRRGFALAVATAGVGLVLAGGLGSLDAVGVLFGLGAALAYSVYILAGAGQLKQTDPLALTALVNTGAGVTLIGGAAAQSDISFRLGAPGFVAVSSVGVVSVAAMTLFLAGVGTLGPARASIVSAIQPGITPVLGLAVFGDRLGAAQILGVGLVIAAVMILEAVRSELDWLPHLERWRLILRARRRRVAAGELLVRQGRRRRPVLPDRGGTLRSPVRRPPRRQLGPGDFFGEIALVEGSRRTADVVAATAMRLRVVGRRDFHAAMRTLPTLSSAVRRASNKRLSVLAPEAQPAG